MASNHPEWLKEMKMHLSKTFRMKVIGPMKTCLGIEFRQNIQKHEVFLSQEKYTDII